MDYLIVKDALCRCNIGVTKKERSKKQPLVVDCKMSVDISKAARSKNLKDTVDYVHVCDDIKRISEGREWVLLETLAEELSRRIMESHNAQEITICVKKPKALAGKAAYGWIEITRRRDG